MVALLIATSMLFYTPARLGRMYALYGVQRAHLQPFLSHEAQALTPALVIVHTSGKWIEYGTLLELQDPFLKTPFIFVISRGERAAKALAQQFPDRQIFHYYPADDLYKLLLAPK